MSAEKSPRTRNPRGTPANLIMGGGRKKGVPNKTTRLLKDAILDAAGIVGDKMATHTGAEYRGVVAYCAFLAEEHPQAFTSLLGKVLPLQIHADIAARVDISRIELVPVDPACLLPR